jgi:hypothetical protein
MTSGGWMPGVFSCPPGQKRREDNKCDLIDIKEIIRNTQAMGHFKGMYATHCYRHTYFVSPVTQIM